MTSALLRPGWTRLALCVLLCLAAVPAQAQSAFPDFPPSNVTRTQDRDQMLWQLGIELPTLPPKLEDPNRPLNAWPVNPADPEGNWTDAEGHIITRSGFGLWNNYDEAQVGVYTPIDLLRMKNGASVTTPTQWWTQRRPELVEDIQQQVWGVVPPANILPGVTWSVATSSGGSGSTAYIQKTITGTIDISRYPQVRNVPRILATLRVPAAASGPVPVIVVIGGFSLNTYWNYVAPEGWGIAFFNPNALQPDNGAGLTSYLIGLVNQGNWRKPIDWGTLAAWGWGVSRLIDYFETDPAVDATKVGVTGHSRFGKAALVTMAYDPRVAIGFPSCAGSLGTKMNRRHWGQDLENSSWDQEYHWMAGNFLKWGGPLHEGSYMPRKVEQMPVDAHALLALVAPRPVFVNAGTQDTWTDPYGEYLTEFNATPVYQLLGGQGVVMPDGRPQVDVAYLGGDLAYRLHNGGHTDAPDWPAFLQWARKYLNNHAPVVTPAQQFTLGQGPVNVVGTVAATDADRDSVRNWQITGGSGAGIFAIDRQTGQITIANPLLLDLAHITGYTLMVTASDGVTTSRDTQVTITVPQKVRVCHAGHTVEIAREAVAAHLRHGDGIGSCGWWPRPDGTD